MYESNLEVGPVVEVVAIMGQGGDLRAGKLSTLSRRLGAGPVPLSDMSGATAQRSGERAAATFQVGDVVEIDFRPDRTIKVDSRMYEAVTRMRSALIVAAQRRSTMTYEDLSAAIDFLYPRQALSRALDLLSQDCADRKEPSLASLVVTSEGGEVSTGFVGHAGSERERCYRYHRPRGAS